MLNNSVTVQRSLSDRVADITIPGGLLSSSAATELAASVVDLREERALQAIMLSSAADDFCLGAKDDLDPYSFRPDPASALATLRPPIIAVVNGRCFDEGLELVLASDIRLATKDTTFRMAQVTQGRLPCWGGTQRLPRSVRPGSATAMTLTGSILTSSNAASLGLVHAVYETTEELRREAKSLAETLLSRGPLALELAKEAVHRGSELPLRDGLRLEGDLNHQLAATQDRAEGLAAFFQKRPPDFSGR